MKRTTLVAAALALAALAWPASAKTYYVKADGGKDTNTGLAEGSAFKTLQHAIDKAASGSTILVYPGTYAPIETVNKKLTIRAVEGAGETFIDGQGELGAVGAELGAWGTQTYKATGSSVTYKNAVTKKTVTIKSYYIYSSADTRFFEVSVPRGGMFVQSSYSVPGMLNGTLYVTAPPAWYLNDDWGDWDYYSWGEAPTRTLGKYHTYTGGAATKLEGFTVTGCHQALRAGTVSSCLVTGNEYVEGEAEDLPGGDSLAYLSKLSDCAFRNNVARQLLDGSWKNCPTATRCEFTDNTISGSGFGYNCGSLFNCLIAGNEVTGYGDLVYLDSPYSGNAAYNCTIAGNTINEGYAVAATHLYGSIVWGNRNGSDPANVRINNTDGGRQIAVDYMNDDDNGSKADCSAMYSDIEGIVVEQKGNKGKTWGKYGPAAQNSSYNVSVDPCFIDPTHGDYHLAPWSPCVDAGADYQSKTGKFDLDSAARKVTKVDMGAYELQPQTAVPADYDGDGITDAAFFFAASGQWWIFQSSDGLRTISLPDAYGTPCPADYDVAGHAEPAYFTAAGKTPEFVRIQADGTPVRETFGDKGATPVAVHVAAGEPASFGVYTANAKAPAFSFLGGVLPRTTFGAKASRPVVADFDGDGADDFGVYTATASKPAFSILGSAYGYAPSAIFAGGPVALGPKGAIPCCADFDGDDFADFAVYHSNTKEPFFQRLFSSSKFRETRTLPMGSKGDVPVVGNYDGFGPGPAVWTGRAWTCVDAWYDTFDLVF